MVSNSINSTIDDDESVVYHEKVNNIKFGDVVQALRQKKDRGMEFRQSLGRSLHDRDIERLVRSDLNNRLRDKEQA